MQNRKDRWQHSIVALLILVLVAVMAGVMEPGAAQAANFGGLTDNGTARFMGIGTNYNTSRNLHVVGSPLFERAVDTAGFLIKRTATNRWFLGVNENPLIGYGFVISTFPEGAGSSTPRLVVAPDGRVGIPATDTGKQLNVETSNTYAIYGSNTSGTYGWIASSNYGVKGVSDMTGVEGVGLADATGVYGTSTSGYGVYGASSSSYAGYFNGPVLVSGWLTKPAGSFKIDHPQEPENKYLIHSFVESPDMMNVYNGNVTLDSDGGAVVELPSYFEALNRDFRYQLTAIGSPGPNLYIESKVADGHFKIGGGTPGSEVSWQVTGIRQDAFANAHPIVVEQEKSANEKGLYLHPVEWGQPKEKGINQASKPQMSRN